LFDPGGDLHGDSVLVRDGRITAVGARADLDVDGTVDTIELHGALLLAGMTDTHTHLFEWARRRAGIDLAGATSFDELLGTLRAAAGSAPDDPEWIGGGGWDPHFLGARERFTRQTLDEVFGERPVFFEARDYHTLWCNTEALRRAGVMDGSAGAPPGGWIGRDADGSPNGLLHETAWELVRDARPSVSDAVADRWLDAARDALHRFGLTGVHCMEPMDVLAHYRRRAEAGRAGLRVCFHTPLDDLDARIERGEPSYASTDPWVRLGGVKVFMDGSMGSRTAAMYADYPDGQPGSLLMDPEELLAVLDRAAAASIAGTVHAIGDRTVDVVVDAIESVRTRQGRNLRHRIEHAQCVPAATVPRLARHDVVCAMQPVHLEDDLPLLEREWGAAAARAYPLREMWDAGVHVCLGSDMPVATPDPWRGLRLTVDRRGRDGRRFHPEQALTVGETLAGYTSAAATAGGWETELGRIAVGMRADLTAVDDVRDEDADAWSADRVRLTVVDGRVVHDAL
jgi:hypothetical protein